MSRGALLLGATCAMVWAGIASADGAMTRSVARGTFELTLKPVAGTDASIASLSLNKVFQGDLQGTSVGQMLAVRTKVAGSAGYVAMERITGSLAGRHGSFVLQHSGTMTGGSVGSVISVIPNSGEDGLKGLQGTLKITQPNGIHHYEFDYQLPTSH